MKKSTPAHREHVSSAKTNTNYTLTHGKQFLAVLSKYQLSKNKKDFLCPWNRLACE